MRALIEQAGLSERIEVDSAGTHAYHIGEAPDLRSQQAARLRGYDLSSLRARQVGREDFAVFDYLLAMDNGHLHLLRRACPAEYQNRLSLFLPGNREVADPYYGGSAGFERTLDLVEEGAKFWIEQIKRGMEN